MEQPLGTGGVPFQLPPRLMDVIRTVRVEKVLRETAFYGEHAHQLLDRMVEVDCQSTPGFARQNWNANTVDCFPEDL